MARPACDRPANDYRSMWAFGMDRVERAAAFRCRRPRNHRGECRCVPREPLPPLRPIRTYPERVLDLT